MFEHRGPHGTHPCLVFKPMGPDMTKYRRLFPKARIPLPIVKKIATELLLALDFLHEKCGVIHTDIKPQNILLETPAIDETFESAPSESFKPHLPPWPRPMISTGLLSRLADFGTASWVGKHLTEWIQPEMLHAPEVILGAQWDSKVGIWNVGLVIWELAEGSLVFDGTWKATAPYTAEAHLAQIEAVLGCMPKSLLARSRNRDRFFDHNGKLLSPSTFPPSPLGRICQNPQLEAAEKDSFLDFIQSMVKLDPEERLGATRLLEAEWLKTP